MADGVVWELDDKVLEDGSGNVIDDCADCPCDDLHPSDCNASSVPGTLRFTVATSSAFALHTRSVFVVWSATACGGIDPGWDYSGGDVAICASAVDFGLRAVTMCCDGVNWSVTIALVNNGIQDAQANPSAFANLTTVDDSPVYLTSTQNAANYSTPCGIFGRLHYYFQHVDEITPACGSDDMPATLTLSYTIGGIAKTVTVSQSATAGYQNSDFVICDLADGHTTIRGEFEVAADSSKWTVSFRMKKVVDGVTSSYVDWSSGNKLIGHIYSDMDTSCRPYHMHYEGTNTGGNTSGGSSVSCGGDTYPFSATAGTIAIVLQLDE